MYMICALFLYTNCKLLYTVYRCFYEKCTDTLLTIIALLKDKHRVDRLNKRLAQRAANTLQTHDTRKK